jgi:hypothetical protein
MKPLLHLVANVVIEVGEPIAVGETGEGLRRLVPILGGRLDGPRLRGDILAAGADYQLIREDGYTALDARYAARLEDGSLLYIVNVGVRYGSPELMARIAAGEPVDPEAIYFRTTPRFETASADHQWITKPLFIAAGARYPDRVELAIYEVD